MSRGNNEGELLHITAGTLEDIVGTFNRTFEVILEEDFDTREYCTLIICRYGRRNIRKYSRGYV